MTRTAGETLGKVKHAVWRRTQAAARSAGFDVLRRHYYSPIPDVAALPDTVWSRPNALAGLRFDYAEQFDFLEGPLAPGLAEARESLLPGGPLARLSEDNTTYRSTDMAVLYALLRTQRPKRVLELGSGASTLIIDAALQRNREEGHACEHRVLDPYPWLTALTGTGVEVERISATDVGPADLQDLESGDVLFVDTTHAVRTGGDVVHIHLDLLPVVPAGVFVHVHDVFLPWEYPRHWLESHDYFWGEQYVLQAFLAFNDEFRPLLAHHALRREDLARLEAATAPIPEDHIVSGFWMRRAD